MKLFDYGMSPDIRDSKSNAPLLFAACSGDNVELFREIVEDYSADITVRHNGQSLIKYARSHGYHACLAYLEGLN